MSELYTARSAFNYEALNTPGNCSGCHHRFKTGEMAYVRHYDDPRNRTRKSRSLLCNLESCWMDWDERVYQGIRAATVKLARAEARYEDDEIFAHKIHYSRVKS